MGDLEEELVMSEAVQELWLERGEREYERLLETTKSIFKTGVNINQKKKEDYLHNLYLMEKDIENDILYGEKCLDFYQRILKDEGRRLDKKLRDRIEKLKDRNQSRLRSFNEKAYECLTLCFDIVREHRY